MIIRVEPAPYGEAALKPRQSILEAPLIRRQLAEACMHIPSLQILPPAQLTNHFRLAQLLRGSGVVLKRDQGNGELIAQCNHLRAAASKK